ncbi:hypothetical protein [Winogradskyella poriferorum]|uniref:Uncharacterized protein n=1 Tax=Winogradskyella poriferorum TaxID=307627 RepID=A0ABU7W3H5_9FLAO
MKKIITLGLLVFAMFIGSQTLTAQNSIIEVNAKASEKTETLRRTLKFDNNQRDKIYEAYKLYIKTEISLSENKKTSQEEIDKNRARLDNSMEEILNDEQFSKYKVLSREENH